MDITDDDGASHAPPMKPLSESASYYDVLGVPRAATEQEVSKGALPS